MFSSNPFSRNIRSLETLPDNTFALLYCQLVDYYRDRVTKASELEDKLCETGYSIGIRLCDKFFLKERGLKRENRVLGILLCLKVNFWRYLFCKEADQLDQATDKEGVYYLTDNDSVVVRYLSLPKEQRNLNCGVFLAGLARAFLTGSGFPCQVHAALPASGTGTTLIIEFDESVLKREKLLDDTKRSH